ncbi:Glyceraldehyde 3-phosphate phosphatase [Candidatus Bilamarchaeum dharawalense]|uniref:Glyceraldehyde 3-phosphate phosphatase n=1 Tax=Candidatus Bilamarchaeum dharawalense TaxID=2885759 RepID=A0A5E4LSS5_9ARCH|nr:Glyceraldehyde 3-phosphate phosphatase [Candidatus Bilamarchaeum dharawalense]
MLKFVLFDIDDTLFPSTEFSTLARKNALNAMISMGLDTNYQSLNSRLTKIIEKKGSNYEGHFNELCRQLKVSEPERFIAAAIAAYHDTKTAIQPFSTVPLTLLHLKESGFKIYVATSGNSIKQWDKLIRLRLALYFDGVFVTEKEKDQMFYKRILVKLKAKPEECIIIGDREDADILPAKSVGIRTIRVLTGKYSSIKSRADFTIRDIGGLLPIFHRFK